METFFTFLERRVDDCSSLLCIGLDAHINDLAAPTAEAALDFCVNIIKQTGRYAAAFKPNAAFFEVFGAEGWTALRQVIEAVQEESNRQGSMIPVILDAKRGDIASTAEAYAKSAFENLKAHCITLNPYLGRDAIEPFLQYPERGVFLLCKTSNAEGGHARAAARDVPTAFVGGRRALARGGLAGDRADAPDPRPPRGRGDAARRRSGLRREGAAPRARRRGPPRPDAAPRGPARAAPPGSRRRARGRG